LAVASGYVVHSKLSLPAGLGDAANMKYGVAAPKKRIGPERETGLVATLAGLADLTLPPTLHLPHGRFGHFFWPSTSGAMPNIETASCWFAAPGTLASTTTFSIQSSARSSKSLVTTSPAGVVAV
jgi:hypothetical protein